MFNILLILNYLFYRYVNFISQLKTLIKLQNVFKHLTKEFSIDFD